MILKLCHQHPWNLTPREAMTLQEQLSGHVITHDALPESIRYVAGVDVGFESKGQITHAAVALLNYPALERVQFGIARQETRFPYIPGLLSFREIPAVLEALDRLTLPPDLLLVDGQGIAHPRRLGIASHLGVLTDIPAIGVAKTRLIGTHDPVPDQRGASVPLLIRGEITGAVLRTRPHVRPLYISPGHRISLPTAIDWVMRCTGRFRLPETTRHAHRLASIEKDPP